jgi:endonuclease/exonuclease/phosphatase (EEP) superfamily protein YafD
LQNAQLLTNVSETNAGAANAAAQFGAGAANTAAITGANISSNQLIANLQASTTLANTTLTGQNAQALQSLTATDQQQLAALNSQYSNLLQTNQNAATSMAQYVATVTAINTGTGAYASTTQATKGTDIQSAFNTLQSSLQGLAQQAPGAVNPGSNFTNPATTPPAGTANNADYTIGGVTYVNSNGVGIPIPATETVT